MDAETLERLLLDRALGALPPDAAALLAAYLERDAAAAARGREFAAAVDTAQQVLRNPVPTGLPPFPVERIRNVERARRQLTVVRKVAGIAAALMLGIGLGAGLFHSGTEQPSGLAPAVRPSFGGLASVASLPPAATKAGGFWSVERVYDRARETRHVAAARLIWDSPIGRPRLGDKQ